MPRLASVASPERSRGVCRQANQAKFLPRATDLVDMACLDPQSVSGHSPILGTPIAQLDRAPDF